ncbi:EAL domain-containing protein [Jeotgalibacillus proteolyticus]|uniref:EAL domain-containing protein n=1 Tax=Jeotgalibacillus proteolyticus TaxID=2082395 RepID=UPI003CED02BD
MTPKPKHFICFIALYMLLYYSLIAFFQSNREVLTFFGSILQVIAPLVAGALIFKQFLLLKGDRIRLYWLLASIAAFSYGFGTFIFRYNLVVYDLTTSTIYYDILWYLSILSFISALIFIMSLTKNTAKTIQYAFDIFIVMVVATSISWHFLIDPLFSLSSGGEEVFTFISYLVGILLMLFAILSIYYSPDTVFPKKVFAINILGFTVLLIANISFLYIMINYGYAADNFSDPLWPLSMLLFGLGSLYNQKSVQKIAEADEKSMEKSGENSLTIKLILPYLSVVTIFVFMIFQGVLEFNSIVIGSIISTLLIIIRQIFTLIQNRDFLIQSQKLNKKLEIIVADRTKELYVKNQELEESMKKVEYIAYHDSLTSLPNRRYFEEAVEEAMGESQSSENGLAILFIDLDRFKFINDTLGHHIGDLLLKHVARSLKEIVGNQHIVSRQGGDEFMILLRSTSKVEAGQTAEKIVKELENPISINGNELFITSSIGITLYPQHGSNADTLIKRADTSMYSAKDQGKNRYQFFNASMDEQIILKTNLENGLRRAIELDELSVVYQPKMELSSKEIIGAEALLRWKHKKYGSISPSTFIPLAEETGLIVKLGDWILTEACLQLKKWHLAGMNHISVSVNVSTIQFLQKDFVEKVENVLIQADLEPRYLELEITESTMMDIKLVVAKLEKLRSMGIKISVDDFGSGYSSLSHLKNLPIDILKIDKTFIDDIENNRSNAAIVSTILNLARNLSLTVIAEGVENKKQYEILKEKGCDQIQGYFLSKPLPAGEIVQLVEIASIETSNTQ